MDEAVVRAMARWPDVPDCHGWLALTRRGEWRIGKSRERIAHAGLVDFVNRNYLADARGAWYFQNGPQRVWVSLDFTPLAYRVAALEPLRFVAHTGAPPRELRRMLIDRDGSLILVSELGPGVIDDRDLPSLVALLGARDGRGFEEACADPAAELVLAGTHAPVERLAHADLESELGFVRQPA